MAAGTAPRPSPVSGAPRSAVNRGRERYTAPMPALQRIVGIVVRPKAEWELIAREEPTVDDLLRRYILPLSLLAPVATMVGMRYFDAAWDEDLGYMVPPQEIFTAGATTLFATIVSVFALAGIFVLIAPMYGSSRDFRKALKVATYGAIPVMLAGATLVLPIMAIIGLAGLSHSLFVYWLGVKQVLDVRGSHSSEFVGISMLMLIAASTLAGAAASAAGVF
jgi:Yip1 domain